MGPADGGRAGFGGRSLVRIESGWTQIVRTGVRNGSSGGLVGTKLASWAMSTIDSPTMAPKYVAPKYVVPKHVATNDCIPIPDRNTSIRMLQNKQWVASKELAIADVSYSITVFQQGLRYRARWFCLACSKSKGMTGNCSTQREAIEHAAADARSHHTRVHAR